MLPCETELSLMITARYLAQWQAKVRVVIEKSAHRHTWIASITRILHYCEAAGLFDSNEPFGPVATAGQALSSQNVSNRTTS